MEQSFKEDNGKVKCTTLVYQSINFDGSIYICSMYSGTQQQLSTFTLPVIYHGSH